MQNYFVVTLFSGLGRKSIDFAGFVWFEISGVFMLYGRFLRTEVIRQIFLPTITAWHWIVKLGKHMCEDAWHFWVVCQDDNMTWHDIIRQDADISQMASSFFSVKSPNNSTQQQGPKHVFKSSWSRGFWRRGNDELTVVVKGFPDTADEATLTSHFAACGEVVRVAWFVSMARGDHTIRICRCRFVYKCTVCVLLQLCLWSLLLLGNFW